MIVLYFIVFILLDVYHQPISSFFLHIYFVTGLSVFEFIGALIRQNTFVTRFIILIPLVFFYARYCSRTGK
jgi:hypothetical protein